MGKRIVINTYGSEGDLNPFFVIGRGMQARGHHVVIATDDFCRAAVESAGLEFHLARRCFPYGNEEASDRSAFNLHNSYDDLMAAVPQADLLMTHYLALAGPLVAASTGVPWVSVALYPTTFASYSEPLMFGTVPGSYHFTPTVYKLYLEHMNHIRQGSILLTEEAQRLRRELGLASGKNILFADHHSPDLVLALFSAALAAPQPHWPSHTRVTGFAFDARITDGAGLSPELARFLDDGTPPIIFTLGSASIFDDGSFRLRSIVAANMLGCRAILLGSFSGSPFANNPHLMSVEYAPYGEVLSRAAAIVHHGGIGTIAAAMRAGCPMLVLPGDDNCDQSENAARAAGLGVARVLPLNEYNALSAAAELAYLLHDPSYAKNAAEISRIVQAEDGVGSACDAIEQYLKQIN